MGIHRSVGGHRGWFFGVLLPLGLHAACGQELVVPFDGRAQGSDGGQATTSGVTGVAGEDAEGNGKPPGRLPVPEKPTFVMFGGAGGESGEGGNDSESQGGSAGRGGSSSGSDGNGGGSGEGSGSAGETGSGRGGKSSSGGSAGGGSGGGGGSRNGGLLITEYLEGSGSFKALEIYATVGGSLEGCALLTFFNGKTEPSSLALHGALDAGMFHVLCSSALATLEKARCDRSTNLTFNGDDAIALACDGVVLDVIGQVGVDPGTAWGEGATADHTLRRSCTVKTGRSDGSQPFVPAAEWSLLAADLFGDLGLRSCDAP